MGSIKAILEEELSLEDSCDLLMLLLTIQTQ